MSSEKTITDLPTEISAKALLGLKEPVGFSSAQLREIQARSMKHRPFGQFAANMICGALVVAISFGIVPLWALAAWALPLTLVSGAGFFGRQSKHTPNPLRADAQTFNRIARHWGAGGVVWGASLPLFGWFGGLAEILGIWSVCVAMMVYASMLMPSVPIAAATFIGAVTIGGVAGWVLVCGPAGSVPSFCTRLVGAHMIQ